MKKLSFQHVAALFILLLFISAGDALAQFRGFWLDIGEYHHNYSEGGARNEEAPGIAPGMEFPAILRESSHAWAKAFWIGTKNWTDERGQSWPYYVARIGPRTPGIESTFPVETKIVSRYEDTVVDVDEALSFDNLAVVEEVDPNLAADRMVMNVHNVRVGVTVTRKIFAYTNEVHDNYHIIDQEFCNTGNVDGDAEIELQGQSLNDVYFFRIHRWRGNAQEGWTTGDAQTWGKFSMIDVVGDGHADYPVNFTAQYLWPGFNPDFTQYNNLGGSLWTDSHWTVAAGDSVGRLAGGAFVGRATIHADTSPTDRNYIRCTAATQATCQPHTLGYMDQDEPLTSDGASHEEYYELGILTRENPGRPGALPGWSSRQFPHYAQRIEPSGEFWNPKNNASNGKQGGHAATTAFGPYNLAFGECVNVVEVEGVAGLSYDARVQIGRAYKRSSGNNSRLIAYDANGDGQINESAFDYSVVGRGSERLTKNQWVMTARDSLLQSFEKGIAVYNASNGMTQYPIPEPPRAPAQFSIFGRPDKIDLTWTAASGGPAVTKWEIYRTSRFEDNLLDADGDGIYATKPVPWGYGGQELITGYQKIADLDASANSFEDVTANRGVDYYYYIVGVGQPQPNDPMGISGTPGGKPLRSSRYLTQSYLPVNLKRPAYGDTGTVKDARIVPNPVNLGSDQSVRFAQEDRMFFYNIPPECTIKIFTEVGELVHIIEHTNGSGDELWNLTTESRQLLVSGIYIAVVEDLSNGEKAFLKFTVIR